jgi:hypothetical protein
MVAIPTLDLTIAATWIGLVSVVLVWRVARSILVHRAIRQAGEEGQPAFRSSPSPKDPSDSPVDRESAMAGTPRD